MVAPQGNNGEANGGSQIKRLPCDHIFHKSCLRSWFQRQQTCPTCRTSILRYNPNAAQAAPAAGAGGAAPVPPHQHQQHQQAQQAPHTHPGQAGAQQPQQATGAQQQPTTSRASSAGGPSAGAIPAGAAASALPIFNSFFPSNMPVPPPPPNSFVTGFSPQQFCLPPFGNFSFY